MSTFSIQKMVQSMSVQTMGPATVTGQDLIRQYLDVQLRPTWNSMSSFQKETGTPVTELVVPPDYPAWLERRILSPEVGLKLRETVTRVYAPRLGGHLSAALHAIDEIQDAIAGIGMQFCQRHPSLVSCVGMDGQLQELAAQPWLTDRFGDVKIQEPAKAPGLVRAILEPFDLLAYAYQCMPVTGSLGQVSDDLCIVFEVPLPTQESEAQVQAEFPERPIKVDPLRYRTEKQMLMRIHAAVSSWQMKDEKPWLTVVRPTGCFQKQSAYQVLWGIVKTSTLRQPGVGAEAVVGAFNSLYNMAAESTLV